MAYTLIIARDTVGFSLRDADFGEIHGVLTRCSGIAVSPEKFRTVHKLVSLVPDLDFCPHRSTISRNLEAARAFFELCGRRIPWMN
jgi:hypothetical protein